MKLELRRVKQILPQILKHMKSSKTWAVHLPQIWAQTLRCWPKGSLGGLVIGGRVWDKGVASLACSKKVIPKARFTVPSYGEGKVTIETQSPQHLIPGALPGFPKGSIPMAAAGTQTCGWAFSSSETQQAHNTPVWLTLGIFSPQVVTVFRSCSILPQDTRSQHTAHSATWQGFCSIKAE